jgi:hypothetical protein
LRFHLLAQQASVTSWLAQAVGGSCSRSSARPGNAETAEVARALQAQKICEAEHGLAHDAIDREVT